MPRAGTGILNADDYLSPAERAKRAKVKRDEIDQRCLTPDWFRRRKDKRLPHGLRVAVIGGGFAGLSAAWYLNELGVATTVFEASDMVGGRVKTDLSFIPKKIVELGAELIGENHPMWGIFADPLRFNLPLIPLTDDDDYKDAGLNVRMRFGKTDLTAAQKNSLQASLAKPLAIIGVEAKLISETAPWQSPRANASNSTSVAETFDRMSVAERFDRDPGVTKLGPLLPKGPSLARSWFRFTLANDNCAEVEEQSYLGLLAAVSAGRMGSDVPGMLGYWMSTETHRCGGGNFLLAEHMVRSLPDVRLRSRVSYVRIDQNSANSRLPVRIISSGFDNHGNPSVLRTDDYHFAVLTAPPSVWNAIQFDPPFDARGRTIQHGNAVKFFSRYGSKFWEAVALAPSAKWDLLGSVWEGTDKQGKPPDFNQPDFDLTVFSGGPHVLSAKEYAERMSILYPTGKPTDQRFVDWSNVPFIKTGYAVPGKSEVTRICRNQIVPHAERLFFAGEQTSPGFFGYMEGALQSGARAARDIVITASLPV